MRLVRPVLALVAIAASVPSAATSAQAQDLVAGECTDNVGITIVVDFQELGGGVNVACAPGAVTSGLDALTEAGVSWDPVLTTPGFVCRIAGRPGPDTESCGHTPPASAYWSYWVAPRGGQWCFSSVGAGSRKPPPGTVEGWSFSFNKVSVDTPPPSIPPPPPIPGEAPNPLRASDCGSATKPPTPTTQPVPATTVPPVAPPPTSPPATATTASASQPIAASSPPSAGGNDQQPAAATPVIAGAVSATTSTTSSASASSTSTSTVADGATTTSSTSESTTTATGSQPITSDQPLAATEALGTVDLGSDGRGGGGFGAATALGVVAVGGLGGAGVWAARRRRAAL